MDRQLEAREVIVSRGIDYIRARLKRDGQAELLAQVDRCEISAHRAAIQAGYRRRTVEILPTVEGFVRAVAKHLSAEEFGQLIERLERGYTGRAGRRPEPKTLAAIFAAEEEAAHGLDTYPEPKTL